MTLPPDSEGAKDRTGTLVARNTAWLVGGPLALNVLSIGSTGYISRTLGSEGFATFGIGLSFAMMLTPLTNMGLRALTVRHVAQHRETAKQYLGTVMALRIALACVAIVVVLFAAPLGSESELTRQVTRVAALGLLLSVIVGVQTDGFHAVEEMGSPARAAMAGGLVLTIASVVVAANGGGPVELAATYLLGPAVNGAMLWWSAAKYNVRPHLTWDPPEFRRLLKEALPFFGQGLFESLSSRIDLIILNHTLGEANLGGYTAARQLAGRAGIVVDGSGTALLPSLARLRKTDPAAATPLLRDTMLWLLMLSLPLAIAIAIAAPEIMLLVFGPGFSDGAAVLAIQILVLPLTASAVVLGHGLFVSHRNRLVVTSSMTSTATTTALVVPLTLSLTTIGAPIANLVGRTVLNLIRMPRALADYPGFWSWRQTRRLAAITLAVVIPFVVGRLAGGGVAVMVAAGIVATLGWVAILWRLDMVPAKIRRLWRPAQPDETRTP